MGDVIQFKPSKKLEELNAQILLEEAISDTWARLGGLDLIIGVREYHLAFLRFSDVCFQLMTKELMIVDDNGQVEMEENTIKKLKDYISQLEKGKK